MKFNTKTKEGRDGLFEYATKLVGAEATVEIVKVSPRRTGQQNRYYRLLLGAFALETGYNLDEAATIFKRKVNPDIFVYEKNGIPFLHSSAAISTALMSKAIDRFHKYSAEAGFPLPLANNEDALIALENRMEQQDVYL